MPPPGSQLGGSPQPPKEIKMSVSIHSPHQLIGAVAALLGFQPEESIVILGLRDKGVLWVLRTDVDLSPDEVIDQTAPVITREDEMLGMLRRGDTVAFWRLDRLRRSLHHLLDVVADLEQRGVAVNSLTESIDSQPASLPDISLSTRISRSAGDPRASYTHSSIVSGE